MSNSGIVRTMSIKSSYWNAKIVLICKQIYIRKQIYKIP